MPEHLPKFFSDVRTERRQAVKQNIDSLAPELPCFGSVAVH